MRKYSEEGARRGNTDCMFAGHDKAMDLLISYYRNELISKEDLATMLRAHKAANDEVNNESIEYALRYLKYFREENKR